MKEHNVILRDFSGVVRNRAVHHKRIGRPSERLGVEEDLFTFYKYLKRDQ